MKESILRILKWVTGKASLIAMVGRRLSRYRDILPKRDMLKK